MSAKILLFDIETAPLVGYAWQTYKTNIIKIIRPTVMLSYAYQWFDDDKMYTKGLCSYPDYIPGSLDDRALVSDLWKLFDEADIIIAQNGDAFDIKKANARFLVHRLPPPSTYQTFDTLKALKKSFKFDSNGLNNISIQLGFGQKVSHSGFDLWERCIAGDPEAWEEMLEYNAHDVVLLRQLYLTVRMWGSHPNVNLYGPRTATDKPPCPTCGGTHVHARGPYVSKTRRYQRWNCQSEGCGHWWHTTLIK